MAKKSMANGKQAAADIGFRPDEVPSSAIAGLTAVAAEPGVGGPYEVPVGSKGCVAYTHFDSPGAENNLVTILLDKTGVERLPMQPLVRVRSQADVQNKARDYLGVIVAGPFAEPDGLRADAALVVSTTVAGHGQVFLPRYHARAPVQILGEEIAPTQLVPARYRPRPNSPVFALNDTETEAVYKADGPARLGVVIGHPTISVGVDPHRKSVLPCHTGILGTTGGGKSTTVARFVQQLTASGVSVVLVDVANRFHDYAAMPAPPSRTSGKAEGRAPASAPPAAFAIQSPELKGHDNELWS